MDGAKKPRNTMMALIARLVVAAYLLYMAWELRGAPAAHDGAERVLFIVAIVAFTAIALVLGGFSLKALLKGEYDKPGSDEEPEGKE